MKVTRRKLFLAASAAAEAARGEKIDCQSHLFSEDFLRYLERRKTSPYVYRSAGDRFVVVGEWRRKILPKHTDIQAKLADMDRNGITQTALSINDPGPELFGKESSAVSVLLNDFIAETVKAHPGRFFGLATLPFHSVEAMQREFERAFSKPEMRGILLYSNLDGRFADEPQFRPVFAEAERRGIPVLLHPAYPLTYNATQGYEMAAGLGLMFDTTIALTRLILAGVLEQHPKLKLVCPHVGGALPYLVGRIDHQTMVLKRGAEHIRRAPSEYLRNVYFDAVSPISLAIHYAYEFAGPDRLLYSSDHPWVDPALIAGNIESLKLPPASTAKIFAGNARKLFGL